MSKKRKRKLNKKKILLVGLFIIVTILTIYLIIPKRYGYQKEVIETFKEDNLYEKIKETKKYSKTLETAILENKFNKDYFGEYLNIIYVENKDFID